jgi:hypothetical protein
MPDLAATVANLRRLRDEATPGPWRDRGRGSLGDRILRIKHGGEAPIGANESALIVSAVNALPTLLDAVEERDRLREEAAKWRAAWAQTSGEHDNPWEGYERTADAIRAPLSRR